MKGGTQAALALGVGYLLGRRRKMRLTTMLAVGAATGGVGGLGGTALRRGMKMLGSTEAVGKFAPQLGELADTVRSDLMDAGKAAATAAVTSRIESLTDSLQERAEMVRDPAAAVVTTLAEEKAINTFFRLQNPSVIARLREAFPDIGETPDARTVFVRLRELRNRW